MNILVILISYKLIELKYILNNKIYFFFFIKFIVIITYYYNLKKFVYE